VDGFEDTMEDDDGHQEKVLDAGTTEMVVGARIGGGHQTEEKGSCSDNSAGIYWSSDINLH
jgi:hypothetical protein